MSLHIVFEDGDSVDGPFQLASATAWGLVRHWAIQQDLADLGELCETGRLTGTRELAFELHEAQTPKDKDVADTVANLAKLVGVGAEDEVARVID